MENTVLKCHCGETKELDYHTSSAGVIIKEGWGVNATFNGKILKMCPKCYEEAKFHAQKLYEITGNEYLSVSHLIREAQKG